MFSVSQSHGCIQCVKLASNIIVCWLQLKSTVQRLSSKQTLRASSEHRPQHQWGSWPVVQSLHCPLWPAGQGGAPWCTWSSYSPVIVDDRGGFWLGLDKIRCLTSTATRLVIDLQDFEGNSAYAQYTNFSVGDSASSIRIPGSKIGG